MKEVKSDWPFVTSHQVRPYYVVYKRCISLFEGKWRKHQLRSRLFRLGPPYQTKQTRAERYVSRLRTLGDGQNVVKKEVSSNKGTNSY